jgi:hypothetical protein
MRLQAEKEEAVSAAAKEAAAQALASYSYQPGPEEIKELLREPLGRLLQLLYFGEVGVLQV